MQIDPAKRRGLKGEIKRIAFSVILFCLLLAPFIPSTAYSSSIADKQRELNSLNSQMGEHRKIIEQKRKEAQTLANEVAIVDAQIRETELALEATRIEIDKTNQEIDIKKKELAHQRKILRMNIRMMYEESEISFLETVLAARSFSDIINHLEYSRIIKEKVDSTIDKITKIKEDLEKKKKSLVDLRLQQEAQAAALNSQRASKASLLAETRGIEELYQNKLASAKKQYSKAKSEMEEMERRAGQGGGYVPPAYPGLFLWPIAPMDQHRNIPPPRCFGCYKRGNYVHSGIDFGWNWQPIRAAADGEVIADGRQVPSNANGCYLGYGNYVKIDHGGGYQTLYAHMWYNGNSPPKKVKRGDIVGYVGNTGCSFGAHLHFEIRYGGWPQDPMNYLP